MKLAEIRGKDSRELRLDIQALRKEQFELRFRAASEEISDTARFKVIRRTIARLNTVLRERELAETEGRSVPAPEGTKGRGKRSGKKQASKTAAGAE